MASGTFAAIRATPELPFVRIFVAVHALRKWDRRLKITMGMTVAAGNRGVFAEQWEFCLGVVKSLQLSDLIPFGGVMA
jgi:hypothetical protein